MFDILLYIYIFTSQPSRDFQTSVCKYAKYLSYLCQVDLAYVRRVFLNLSPNINQMLV